MSERLKELANRLIKEGPKASHVSCSETHEISDGILEALDKIAELEKERDKYKAANLEAREFIETRLQSMCIQANRTALSPKLVIRDLEQGAKYINELIETQSFSLLLSEDRIINVRNAMEFAKGLVFEAKALKEEGNDL